MAGVAIDFPGVTALNNLARIHYVHSVGVAGYHPQVVGDDYKRDAEFAGQGLHQLQNLGLDRHIKGGCRFISDYEPGITAKGHGNHRPLPHTAAELVRVLAYPPFRVGDTHSCQQVD